MRVGHLLTHRSGVRHYRGREDWIAFHARRCASPRDAAAYIADDPLLFAPGADELYSTFGMAAASQVLMDVYDVGSFDGALTAGLGFASGLSLDAENAETATPYFRVEDGYRSMALMSAECKFGGGGLIGSSAALAEIGRAAYSGRIVPTEALRELLLAGRAAPEGVYSYAMGAGLAEIDGEEVLYLTSGGGAPGGRGYLLVLVEPRIAVAFTANAEGDGAAVAALAQALALHFHNSGGASARSP